MISAQCKPPFTAYRLTPKRQVAPIKIVGSEVWGSGTMVFISDRNGTHYQNQLWATELEAIEHVLEWSEQRKADLKAELAKLEASELRLRRRSSELTHPTK